MADICDVSDYAIERELSTCLAYRKPVERPTGKCAWCEEPCEGRYCSKECGEDHAKYKARHG